MNDYQHQFLNNLNQHRVRYLIIGGQARAFFDPSVITRDLDIWAEATPENWPLIGAALKAWWMKYSQHTAARKQNWPDVVTGIQVYLPDTDGCLYLDSSTAELVDIDAADGIDLLTKPTRVGREFEDCFRRAKSTQVAGVDVRIFAARDESHHKHPREQ